jgi:hypothetical protein
MNPTESFSKSDDNPLDEAFRAVRGRDVPAGPSEKLVDACKAAVRQLAQESVPSPRGESDRGRNARRVRYWAIGLAASAALLIAVISLPRATSAALFSKAMEKFSRFTTLKMEMVRMVDGKDSKDGMGMLYFRGNTWSHFAKNHGRRGDPDPVEAPVIGAVINDLDRGKALAIDYSTRTWSWMDFKSVNPIPSRLVNFAKVKDRVVKHLGQELLGKKQTEVYEVKVDELLGRLTEAKVTVWIDPHTELPVQIRSDETFNGPDGARVETTDYRDIEWNPELEDRFFSLVPPAGFKQGPGHAVVPIEPNAPPPPVEQRGD